MKECKEFLTQNFTDSTVPSKTILAWIKPKLQRFYAVKGSSAFQVMTFSPENMTIKAAPKNLCLLKKYTSIIGPCELFTSHDIVVENLKQMSLQWNLTNEISASEENDKSVLYRYQKPFLEWQLINLDMPLFGLSKFPRKEIIVRMITTIIL